MSRLAFVLRPYLHSAGWSTPVVLVLLLSELCAGASAQNLLSSPGFEAGVGPWSVLSSSAVDVSYGSADAPALAVANRIGGGNRLLRDLGGNAIVEQIVTTGPIPAGENVEVRGFLGAIGASNDSAQLFVRFLGASGNEIAIRSLPPVTRTNRNDESVVMIRSGRFAPPLGTEQIAVRIEFRDQCCGGQLAVADEFYLGLTTQPLIPPALPLDTELIVNGRFESGYASGSALTLSDPNGWEGAGGTSVVKSYSNVDTTVPDVVVASVVSGGTQLLSDLSGSGGMQQTIDLRGNAAQIAVGLDVLVSAYLGAAGSSGDTARVEVQFLDTNQVPVGSSVDPLGPVARFERNEETVVLRRERAYSIPPGTAYLRICVAFVDVCCGGASATVDNVSAMLVAPVAPAPLPFGVNILSGGSFEMGSLIGSPLELNNPSGWRGSGTGSVQVLLYGSTQEVPDVAFASMNGLGGALLSDGSGNGALVQRRDLRGLADLIDQGQLRVDLSARLGGFSSSTDRGLCVLRFLNEFGVPIGLPMQLGPVTASDRSNQTTLLPRMETAVAPFGARDLSVEVEFMNECCGTANASCDAIQVILNDNSSIGVGYCNAAPNSTGAAGELRATGSELVSENNVTLVASRLPAQQFGFFLNSQLAGFVPNAGGSQGNLCLGGAIGRYIVPVLQSSPMGVMTKTLDLPSTPTPTGFVAIAAGQSWYFQAWHRDFGATPTSNFTRGLRIDFQ